MFLVLLQSALYVERQVIGWFTVEHPDSNCCTPSGKFPVFLLQDEDEYWYGFPQFGHNGLKIGKFDREDNVVAHPHELDKRVLLQDEQVRSCNSITMQAVRALQNAAVRAQSAFLYILIAVSALQTRC